MPPHTPEPPDPRAATIDAVIAVHLELMQRLSDIRTPEFLEVAITMPQAKVLHLVGTAREIRMSDLVARLGVSLSTVSGLVDRLVDHGYAARRDDPTDRRHVVVSITDAGEAFIERFRDLSVAHLRDLLLTLDPDALDTVRRALAILADAARTVQAAADRKDPRS